MERAVSLLKLRFNANSKGQSCLVQYCASFMDGEHDLIRSCGDAMAFGAQKCRVSLSEWPARASVFSIQLDCAVNI